MAPRPKKKKPPRPRELGTSGTPGTSTESTALVPRGETGLSAKLSEDLRHAADLAAQSLSENTRRAYSADIKAWQEYAVDQGLAEFPISSGGLAAFIAHMDREQGLRISTIRRRVVALAQWHRERGELPPNEDVRVREELRGLARTRKTAPKKKRALTTAMARSMLEKIDAASAIGQRDRTVILVGLATGMRRSELAALIWDDVLEDPDGLVIRISQSKTDQEGKGQFVGIPYIEDGDLCPASALLAWRDSSGGTGSVFGVSGKTIYRIVKRYTAAAGLNPDEFGAHSFRSGFATEAGREGASLEDVMAQTRHTNREVAQGYMQQAEIMENRAVRGVLRRLQRK